MKHRIGPDVLYVAIIIFAALMIGWTALMHPTNFQELLTKTTEFQPFRAESSR